MASGQTIAQEKDCTCPPQARPALIASGISVNLETHCKAWKSEPLMTLLLGSQPLLMHHSLCLHPCETLAKATHIPILPASSLTSLGRAVPSIQLGAWVPHTDPTLMVLARSPSASIKGQGLLRDEHSLASSQHWPCPFYVAIHRAPCKAWAPC